MKFSEITIHVKGYPFALQIWEYEDGSADVEARGLVESPHLFYPGSSLVEVFAGAECRSSHLVEDIHPVIVEAMSKV